jgi:hypothetical protein
MRTYLTPPTPSITCYTHLAHHLGRVASVAALAVISQAASAQATVVAEDSFEAQAAATQPWQTTLPPQEIRFDTSDGLQSWIQTSPIPEPGTYAMWLVGIAAMGFVARRRRIG